jgi:hypothetical protein
MRLLVPIAVGALLLGACGDDGEGGGGGGDSGDGGGDAEPELQPAEGVTAEASPVVAGDDVTFDVTLTNSGEEPVGVVDPQEGGRLGDLDGGAVRLSLLRASADPSGDGEALPPDDGLYLRPGASTTGTAHVIGGWDEPLPAEVEVCVEVVTEDVSPDGDDGATFPYRRSDEPATVACTERLTVDEG